MRIKIILGYKNIIVRDIGMYSMDKYGKLKKQIDRYFLPFELNPNIIIDALKQQQRRLSPLKNKNQTITKFNEQVNKFELLKVTGKEFHSNFTPLRIQKPKTRTLNRDKLLVINPHKQTKKNQIREFLTELFDEMVDLLSKDGDSHLYLKDLSEIIKLKLQSSQKQLNFQKNVYIHQETEENDLLQQCQKIVKSNAVLYRKIISTSQLIKSKQKQPLYKHSPIKRNQFSDTFKNKKISHYKPFIQKGLSPHEVKKINSFTQYRQFLMIINMSNKVYVHAPVETLYKGFICKGNNGTLVKSILKSRPWWCLRSYTDIQNCCIIWSQWKKTKATNNLPSTQAPQYSMNSSINSSIQSSQYLQNGNKISTEGCQPSGVVQKKQQIKKLMKMSDLEGTLTKYIVEESDSSYFSFSKRVHERAFADVHKKLVIGSVPVFRQIPQTNKFMLNHLPGCLQLHSKRLLFSNLKKYYDKENKNVFDVHPLTFIITKGEDDPEFTNFLAYWRQIEQSKERKSNKVKNIWICKPGENSNRGNGIAVVSTIEEIKNQIKNKIKTNNRTLIIQKYLEQPFLYNRRKFDIRCFILVTSVNGIIKGYWYNDGYLRTTSKQYNLKNLENRLVHLTNDAIQKRSEEYGKYENSNKISISDFQKYLQPEDALKFNTHAKGQIKKIATDLIISVAHKLNPQKKQFAFQIFGLDYMFDKDLKPYLIQANSNPSLEVDGSVLGKVIPQMIENAIKIAVDPIFPPPLSENPKSTKFSVGNPFEQNKFELVYDELFDRRMGRINEENQMLEDDEMEEEEYLFGDEDAE